MSPVITKTLLRAFVLACHGDDEPKENVDYNLDKNNTISITVRGKVVESLSYEGSTRDEILRAFYEDLKKEILENITYTKKYLKDLAAAACDAGLLQD